MVVYQNGVEREKEPGTYKTSMQIRESSYKTLGGAN